MYSVNSSVSAAGSAQGNATALSSEMNVVTTVGSGEGVKLPTGIAGWSIIITNAGANSLKVYPVSGSTINSLGTDNPLTMPTGNTLLFVSPTTTQWYTPGVNL
jgi:hypothetical protein